MSPCISTSSVHLNITLQCFIMLIASEAPSTWSESVYKEQIVQSLIMQPKLIPIILTSLYDATKTTNLLIHFSCWTHGSEGYRLVFDARHMCKEDIGLFDKVDCSVS